jgi:hypothetical protein
VIVPWTNKKLDITFASFRSKLLPGQEEEWQVKIAGSKGEKVAAELLAGMYDASLDVFHASFLEFQSFQSQLFPSGLGRNFSIWFEGSVLLIGTCNGNSYEIPRI